MSKSRHEGGDFIQFVTRRLHAAERRIAELERERRQSPRMRQGHRMVIYRKKGWLCDAWRELNESVQPGADFDIVEVEVTRVIN